MSPFILAIYFTVSQQTERFLTDSQVAIRGNLLQYYNRDWENLGMS